MWDEQTEQLVDATIDRVAREMTEGAAAPDLRARVLARIDGAPSAHVWKLMWVAPAAIAALLLVAFGIWSRIDSGRVPAAGQLTSRQTARQEHEPRTPDFELRTLNSELRTLRPEPKTLNPNRTLKPNRTLHPERGTENPPSAVAALAPPPLAVDPLGVSTMAAIDSIQLSEITVPPIDVAPLTLDDRPISR